MMNIYISLLRGINVSGHKKVSMQELKKLYESLGFDHVTTYIQSGNVVFQSSTKDVKKTARQIEQAIQQHFNFDVDVFIYTPAEFGKIIANNSFVQKRKVGTTKCHVTFLSTAPQPAAIEELKKIPQNTDEYIVKGNIVYLFCPNGYGRTKLTNTTLEKKLGVRATTRNWNTVNKLVDISTHIQS